MVKLIVFLFIIFTLSAHLTSADDGPVTEPIPLLLWAASDPAEEGEVKKLEMKKFVNFVEEHRIEIAEMYEQNDAVGATLLMVSNAAESGTNGVIWPVVFAKINLKKQFGTTEDKEHGVPSLVAWAMRKTGPGTTYASVGRTNLVIFILEQKAKILNYLNNGDVDGLVNYFIETASDSGSKDIDWKAVINYLKDNRQLFKYPCGFLNLQLCDRLAS